MLIDEIYSAAIQGNHALLDSLLSRRQVNLNQMYDAGVSGGVRTRFPLLFSVLNVMSQRRLDAYAISLLVHYGADVNGFVQMECAGAVARIPFLAYAMLEWNSPEMAHCLLSSGADPSGAREVTYPDGRQSASPLLCLALSHPDAVFAELLLRAGADPNQHADVYVQNGSYNQQLPPLYYALIQQQSQQKCQLLFHYGASAHFPIALSERAQDRIPFKRYVQVVYPLLAPMLEAAGAQQASTAAAPIRASATTATPVQAAAPVRTSAPIAEYDRYDDDVDDYDDYDDFDATDSNEDIAENMFLDKESGKKEKARHALGSFAASVKDRLPSRKEKAAKKKTAPQPTIPYDPSRRCYGKFSAYLFGNFGILTLAFMIIAPLCFMGSDKEMAQIFFFLGLPCLAICALIWWRVSKKANPYGARNVMPLFVLDSLLMFVRFMLIMLDFTIPLVKLIGSNIQWEQRTTSSGRTVTVKRTGEDEYEDVHGNRYSGR